MSSIEAVGVLSDRWAHGRSRTAGLVVAGAALTGLLAQVALPVPGTPVPFTLQTLGVILAGATLGTRRAVLSMGLYVALGAAGVPWFAHNSSGLHLPTFGYLIGFILAAAFVGQLSARGGGRGFWSACGLMIVGSLVIYAVGVPVLALATGASWVDALLMGAVPFLIGDFVKILMAAGLLPGAWAFVNRGSDPV
ncbi:biotin transporter BioY [Intrasporangium calvum]|uniref:Biotin transporter n=1 Tax=Intrasporangium calvum TaxID=53358 RepID=A0ABT5GE52_9MICO|nr:biotin transporter BioY [Intrasporangium calvum]MDC5696538.1 biotin transporter BioY [Intrasporangium calvum]